MLDHPYKASVLLLDGQIIELLFSANSSIFDILPSIPTSTKSDDARLIHYAVHDDLNHLHWLTDDKRLIDFVDVQTKTICIQQHIRYFVDSVLSLNDPVVVELYFLEALQQLNKNVLDLSQKDLIRIASLLLQIYSGDYNKEQHLYEQIESVLPNLESILIRQELLKEDFINELTMEYNDLIGEKRGTCMLRLMKILEKCVRYGCRYYHIREDGDGGDTCVLAINTNGILVYNEIYSREPKNFFHWQFMDNIYYRNDKFWIEIRETRRAASVIGTDAKSFLETQSTDDAELLKAVNDPTTQFSIPRRSLTTPCVNVYSFRCDSSMLCKTIWQTAIAQHRFFLEQTANKSRNPSGSVLNHQDLNDRLNRLISKSSIGSSLPSLSSLHSTSSLPSMPSAKIADGSCSSLSSMRNGDNKTASGCNGNVNDDKKRELEHYNKLTKRRQFLDEKLQEKMKELFNVCLLEAEYTGEIPKEMKFALFPGQAQPKIRKRIGTSFSIPERLIAVDKTDKLGLLETDVELHRRIVAAAEKLAMDKSTNKSVRKKRLRDYQAAAQKLRGLEMGLSQLRLSISKPDVSSKSMDDDDQADWTGYCSSGELLTRAVAKSCPTTPRGSIPDLFNKAHDEDVSKLGTSQTVDDDYISDYQEIPITVSRRTPSKQASLNERDSIASSSGSSITGFTSPPSSLMLMTSSSDPICTSSSPRSNSTSSSLRGPSEYPKMTTSASMTYNTHDGALCASPSNFENVGYRSKSYRSSYRQAHYPTIQDEQYSRKRAVSAHALPSSQNGISSRAKMPSTSSIRTKSTPSDDDATPTADNPPVTTIGSSATLQLSNQKRKPLPNSVSCSAGFTASLDRRSSLRSPPQNDHLNQSSSRSPSAQRVTTFPVSVQSNQQASSTSVPHQSNVPSSSSSSINNNNGNTILPRFQPPIGRSPLAYFSTMTKSTLPSSTSSSVQQSKLRPMNSSLSSSRIPSNTDPHMEALLSYYKNNPVANHQPRPAAKTATTV
ncbi:unnamed protein product [Auanema sp. JU1783]|nr:unnamed protein product [Auanema sp. JU1783]